MKPFNNLDDILDFAIDMEQKSIEFYNDLAQKAKANDMKETFYNFVEEEIKHKAKLVKIKEEKVFNLGQDKIQELNIADYVEKTEPKNDMTYQEALILAMKREKAAFRLYTKLANQTSDPEFVKLFLSLAQEESKHKLMFEIEYDEIILKEN
ncbi:MAG TPA: ferritin family protein [Bacteroidales bacterium]|jgi:rubrerythrin|nr:ferritin family protein [Bacteroidales bacterium]